MVYGATSLQDIKNIHAKYKSVSAEGDVSS